MKCSLKLIVSCFLSCTVLSSCIIERHGQGVWGGGLTTGHYKDSRQNLWENEDGKNANNDEEDFISLNDADLKAQFADGAVPQPKMEPGADGSGLPAIDGFAKPTGLEASLFKNLNFNTDDHILRSQESLAKVDEIAKYLNEHPAVFVFIEGHCDARGPEAYNLALGTRRADYIRTLLVKKGVDPERLHTISYGKEKPVAFGETPEAWSKNRRAEFKIFKK